MSESLLNLRVIPSLPRKYEDTKPALNQAFTHTSILEIGSKIVAQADEQKEKEKQTSLQNRERELWEKAEEYKNQCVNEALKEENERTKKNIKKLQDEHEKHLQSEISRVEGIWNHRCVEKVHEERVTSEKKLNDVVAKLYASFAIEKAHGIETARREEKGQADQEKEDLRRELEIAMEEQRSCDAEQTLLKLEELRNVKDAEKIKAVENAVRDERKLAHDKMEQLQDHFENLISILQKELECEEGKLIETEENLKKMTNLKDKYIDRLGEIKQAFLGFIEKSRPDFSKGQADYLIPQSMFEANIKE